MGEFTLTIPKSCGKCSKFMSKNKAYRIDKRMFVDNRAAKEAARTEILPIVQKLLADRVSFCADCNRELRNLGIATIKVTRLEGIIRRARQRRYEETVKGLIKRFNGNSPAKSGRIRQNGNSSDNSKDVKERSSSK